MKEDCYKSCEGIGGEEVQEEGEHVEIYIISQKTSVDL